jgi:hypothetical protein
MPKFKIKILSKRITTSPRKKTRDDITTIEAPTWADARAWADMRLRNLECGTPPRQGELQSITEMRWQV